MVDIGDKRVTERIAVATARVRMQPATLKLLMSGQAPKGDVLAVARVAAIQAAKRTPELIPLCHQVALTGCTVELTPHDDDAIDVLVRVRAADRTGAEMEALVAAAIGALTIYDMLKSVDRSMTIEQVALVEKSGGKSGTYKRK
jgi:cyclic pyranopterin phosphate synthase